MQVVIRVAPQPIRILHNATGGQHAQGSTCAHCSSLCMNCRQDSHPWPWQQERMSIICRHSPNYAQNCAARPQGAPNGAAHTLACTYELPSWRISACLSQACCSICWRICSSLRPQDYSATCCGSVCCSRVPKRITKQASNCRAWRKDTALQARAIDSQSVRLRCYLTVDDSYLRSLAVVEQKQWPCASLLPIMTA